MFDSSDLILLRFTRDRGGGFERGMHATTLLKASVRELDQS
jgi:hypothetical protein